MNNDTGRKPDNKKRSGVTKVLDLILRSFHIGMSGVFLGGVVLTVPYATLSAWHHLAIATGVAMIIFNIFKCRHWPYQGRGLVAVLHIALVWFVHVRPDLAVQLLAIGLAVGVTGSHMPAFLRHWSLVHRRVI